MRPEISVGLVQTEPASREQSRARAHAGLIALAQLLARQVAREVTSNDITADDGPLAVIGRADG